MPFRSENQKRYLWAKHPDIAKRWSKEGKGYVKGKKKPSKRNYSDRVIAMAKEMK